MAHCPPVGKGPCETPPSFGCVCGLYVRYEPVEDHLLPYVAGSVLAWGRVVHHAERFLLPGREGAGTGLRSSWWRRGAIPEGEAEEKLFRVAELLGAEVVEDPGEAGVEPGLAEDLLLDVTS